MVSGNFVWLYVDLGKRGVTKTIKWGCVDSINISNKSKLFLKI